MTSLYSILRCLFHKVVPASARELPIIKLLSQQVVLHVATHNELYTETYYEEVDSLAEKSAPAIVASIIKTFKASHVIDVGCGTGALLKVFQAEGRNCFGLEYSDAGLRICRSRGLEVRKFDLERDNIEMNIRGFDLAVSMEVAEHLPMRCAGRFVELLTSLAPVIVFTAATPGQGGVDHVNEQPHEYWISLFETRAFRYDKELSEGWRREWETCGVTSFYYKNLMIFRQTAPRNETGAIREPIGESLGV